MGKWRMGDEEFERQFAEAKKRGQEALENEPLALSVCYDRRRRRVVIELNNGCTFMFPPALAQGLSGASPTEIADVRILGVGQALAWDKLDTHFSIKGLLNGRFGNDAWMAAIKPALKSRGSAAAKPVKAKRPAGTPRARGKSAQTRRTG